MAIKIAADSNIIIALSKFMDPKFDPDNELHDLMALKTSLPSAIYPDLDKKDLPPILKDRWMGQLAAQADGTLYYQNLLDIYNLAKAIQRGQIELCVTPLVYLETYRHHIADFIKQYCPVLTVKDSDAEEFYALRNQLAEKYVESGAMEATLNGKTMTMQPSNDAYIMAEAALFGLDLITANEKDFIHKIVADADYKRQNGITQVNYDENIVYKSNIKGQCFIPTSKNLASFLSKLKKHFRKRINGIIFNENPNIDENKQYHSL